MKFETKVIHAGYHPDPQTGAIMPPIYQTSTYLQDEVGKHRGYEYSRTGNPTRTVLEATLAALEGGEFGLAFASGMAGIDTVLKLLNPGDHILAGNDVYGGTFRLFDKVFQRYGLDFSFVDASNIKEVESGLRDNTRLIWVETHANPLLGIIDIEGVKKTIKNYGYPDQPIFVVDNTFATPYLQRPLYLGADLVVHSTTKYMGGHSDVIGGAVLTNSRTLFEKLAFLQNAAGAIPGPMDCFLVLRGIKTLPVRMDRHSSNAAVVAEFLHQHPRVASIRYPFHETHPHVKIAQKQMSSGGGMVSFIVKGGSKTAKKIAESTKIFALAESLGGVESLIEIPAAMTHLSVSESRLAVNPGLIRLSVGIEHIDDLIADLDQALGS